MTVEKEVWLRGGMDKAMWDVGMLKWLFDAGCDTAQGLLK